MHSLTECYCDIDMNEAHVWAYSIDNSTVNEKSIQCEKFPHSFIMTFHSQAVGMLYNIIGIGFSRFGRYCQGQGREWMSISID